MSYVDYPIYQNYSTLIEFSGYIPNSIKPFIEFMKSHHMEYWSSLSLLAKNTTSKVCISFGYELERFELATVFKEEGGPYFMITLKGLWFYDWYKSKTYTSCFNEMYR